jgi:NAD(P)-dependent dehydrogenase (short-subunit alcohol dehydrogenase family)
VVNNAARVNRATLADITAHEIDETFAVNTRAPLLIIQRTLPMLRAGGRIINISSLVTRIVPPEIGYVMSKGAIDVMTRALAACLGSREITVNAVAPGMTATDTFPELRDNPDGRPEVTATIALGRVGQPSDIADVVAFPPRTRRGGSPGRSSTRPVDSFSALDSGHRTHRRKSQTSGPGDCATPGFGEPAPGQLTGQSRRSSGRSSARGA